MLKSSPTTCETERHRAGLTRYIRSLVHNSSTAEDLAQETLFRAHRQRTALRDPEALESWLYRIATRVCIDHLRQQARTIQRQADTPIEDLLIADQERPSQLTVIQQAEMSECVQRYITGLSDAYKAVLLLHDADGLTASEIAQLLRLPLTTVKMRLHRARRQLGVILKKACAFGRDERGVFVCDPQPGSK
jgi:RNA polymerase sigma factor (sigma-70 family)